ncbi:MAG TPA: bifunctional adenosylcobinamide kinase/adenosylcobinamide-phosphate guanylyltransferase [Micromonosporaceae bacterium]|jgi:adenosyl cobinamide kinase/adenosyl cobinamide phosphate guanylyltransferase/NaMN:DMB phosphoribosyltransferase
MSRQPRTVLVLGGIRSGKSAFAESLVADAPQVRYVATAAEPSGDAEWAARIDAHRDRRPDSWTTDEIGKSPEDLATMISGATAADTILVDDIGGWLTALLDVAVTDDQPGARRAGDLTAAVESLALAVGSTPARVVIVAPETGLSVIPATPLGRTFADASGSVNRTLAEACDGLVLVVAGQPLWIKATAGRMPVNAVVTPGRPERAQVPVPATTFDLAISGDSPISLGMSLPLPDTAASTAATQRAESLPLPGAGFGAFTESIAFAAGVQGTEAPEPFRSVRAVLVHGVHQGALADGEAESTWSQRLAETHEGSSPLARLAADAGVSVEIVDAGQSEPVEDGNAATDADIEAALHRGWAVANAAADRGDDLIVLAAGGPGIDAAAAAVVAALTTYEVPALLGRVWDRNGRLDDDAWMHRVIVIRDALLRLRGVNGPASDAPTALAAVGGPALATATGVVLGAASRRTAVLIDGPVGAAAALLARDYAAQTRMWCLLTDLGNQPTVKTAADMLGLQPLVDLGLGLGEGCAALATLPMIQSALAISSTLQPAETTPPAAETTTASETTPPPAETPLPPADAPQEAETEQEAETQPGAETAAT